MTKNEAQRTSNKRSIIRMSQLANGFTYDTPLEELETTLDMLDDYWSQFQTVQLAIEATCGPKEIDMQVVEMVDTERVYQSTKSTIKVLIKRLADQNNRDQGGGYRQGNQQGQHNQGHGNQQGNQPVNVSKLPKLELPQFDGTYIAWTAFKDMFTSMVKDQAGIADAQKLQYLKISCNCKCEADDIVSEYQTIDANFDPAWKALEHRFENPRMIISSHLKLLFEQPIMISESAESLRLLLRTTQKSLRSLKILGGPVEHWDWLLIHLILARLDSKTRRYWELTHTTKAMATFDQLVKALENRCNALETDCSSEVKVLPTSSSFKQMERTKQHHSSKVLNSSISASNCPICGSSHVPAESKEFLGRNYDGRTELASKYSLCFKCLKPNHNFRSCNSKCQRCSRKHHVLLHNPSFDNKRPETIKPTSNATVPVAMKQNHVLLSDSHSLVGTSQFPLQGQILLSTALVKIRTGYGNWVLARAFLDGGSQSCVITQKCVQRFNLRKTSCSVPELALLKFLLERLKRKRNSRLCHATTPRSGWT